MIETPPFLSPILINMMFYVDQFLALAFLQALTLQYSVESHKILEKVQRYNGNVQIRYVVSTFVATEPIDLNVIRLSEAPGYYTEWEYSENSQGEKCFAKIIERV